MSVGFVRRAGWETDEESGISVFRAVVEYPNGPPSGMTANIVWNSQPVVITVLYPGNPAIPAHSHGDKPGTSIAAPEIKAAAPSGKTE